MGEICESCGWRGGAHKPGCQRRAPTDAINPAHYRQGGVECIEAIKAALGDAGFEAFLQGQVIKYMWRFQHKNGLEDLRKADWYLQRLIKERSNGS